MLQAVRLCFFCINRHLIWLAASPLDWVWLNEAATVGCHRGMPELRTLPWQDVSQRRPVPEKGQTGVGARKPRPGSVSLG